MMPATTHRLPRPSALGSCAEPSWVQHDPNTRGPQRRNRVSSTTTSIGASWSSSLVTISRASARPSRSASHACVEKNRHTAWNDTTAAIPLAASMPTTVRRTGRATKPVASSANNPNVDDRRNAGRNVSNTTRHESGTVRHGSIGGNPIPGLIFDTTADASSCPGPDHGDTPTNATSAPEITWITRVRLRNSSSIRCAINVVSAPAATPAALTSALVTSRPV